MIHPARDQWRSGGRRDPEDRILPDRTVRPTETPADRATSDPLQGASRSGLDPLARPELDGGEELLLVLRGIGSIMFLTTERMIVARDGFERRPRSGIQSFPLVTIRHLRLELGASPSGRIAVWTAAGHEVVSMFFDARAFDRAHELIDVARPLIARARRREPGSGGPTPQRVG